MDTTTDDSLAPDRMDGSPSWFTVTGPQPLVHNRCWDTGLRSTSWHGATGNVHIVTNQESHIANGIRHGSQHAPQPAPTQPATTQPPTTQPAPPHLLAREPSGDWSEGRDGPDPSYEERLWPGPAVWLTCLALVGALAVAYAKALGVVAGLVLGIGGIVLAAATISATAAVVRVDSRVLRAGRGRLPLEVTGAVIVADRAATKVARGPQGDPTAHMVTAIGVHEAIVVEVCDSTDPHRTWLISSRRPADLARAVEAARGKVCP